eukprot:gene1452-1600_t
MKKLTVAALLPKSELNVFDGNPIKYFLFIRSFQNKIVRNGNTNGAIAGESPIAHQAFFSSPVQQPAQLTRYLYDQLKRYFNQDFGESNVDSQKTMSVEDCRALTVFKDSIQLHDDHYNVSISWKGNPPDLPNNRRLAQKRLEYRKNRLQEDPSLKQK